MSKDKDKPQGDKFNGYEIDTETGKYGVCARDNGIEVTQNGELIFTSEGAGSNVKSHTLEAHNNPELVTIIKAMNTREKEMLVRLVVHYSAKVAIDDELTANKLAHKELAEKISSGRAEASKKPHQTFFRATPLGKTIAQRLV